MLAIVIVHPDHCESIQAAARRFEDLTRAKGCVFHKATIPREALQILQALPAIDNSRRLIMWCTTDDDRNIPNKVAEFTSERGEMFIYAQGPHWSGELAIPCVNAGAIDFLVDGAHGDEVLENQIGLAKNQRPAYGSYHLQLTGSKVFVIMPYWSPEAIRDYQCGILPALEGLGMHAFLSRDERHLGPLP